MSYSFKKLLAFPLLFLCLLSAHAEDGKTNYNIYCGACHSPDGLGAGNGAFPPLANSEWVRGGADRMTQVVLHGLTGPIEVAGKAFNLVMPPQGDALTDDQIASIVSYVRTSWGNKESKVTAKYISQQRDYSKAKTGMWESSDLLKRYPLRNMGKINELLSYNYKGRFTSIEQLRESKSISAEEEHVGLINPSIGGNRKTAYGIVWEGWLEAPADGEYTFSYKTNKGGVLSINGKEVVSRESLSKKERGQATLGKVTLPKGRLDIKVEYYHLPGHPICELKWSGPSVDDVYLYKVAPPKSSPPIHLIPKDNAAIIHRNFFDGNDSRNIAVGYTEGTNLLFSADSMNLDKVWKGNFIDVGMMWTDRGNKSKTKILSRDVTTINEGVPLQFLDSEKSPWESSAHSDLKPRFKGYKVDVNNHPTFLYSFGTLKFEDHFIPSSDGMQLTRQLSIDTSEVSKVHKTAFLRILSSAPKAQPKVRHYGAKNNLSIEVSESTMEPVVRESDIVLPIPLKGEKEVITINYIWK